MLSDTGCVVSSYNVAKTLWLQFGPNLAGHFEKVMAELLGPKWPKLGKPKITPKGSQCLKQPPMS